MTVNVRKKHFFKEYILFSEAWLLMALARSMIFFIPFRKLLPLLGNPINQEEAEKAKSIPVVSPDFLQMIQFSILRAAKRSPWRTKCFEQALTARMMLRRRNIKSVIFFGVNIDTEKTNKRMTAHAWLISSDFAVTGGKNNKMFTVVGRFVV